VVIVFSTFENDRIAVAERGFDRDHLMKLKRH
jgi:hypothetical protein